MHLLVLQDNTVKPQLKLVLLARLRAPNVKDFLQIAPHVAQLSQLNNIYNPTLAKLNAIQLSLILQSLDKLQV